MTMLPKIKTGALAAAFEVIFPVYEKACRIIEAHSQPLETLEVRPTLDGLRKDWENLQKAVTQHREA